MATVEELVKQYETDEALQKEVAGIVADGKIHLNLKTKCYNARKEEEKKKNYGNKSKENL